MKTLSHCSNFIPHLMGLYFQIGYCYREIHYQRAAMDYFKKLLMISWQNDSAFFEAKAYYNIAMGYYLMEYKKNSLELAEQAFERFTRGFREHPDSTLRRVYVTICNTKDRSNMIQMNAQN